MLHGNSHQNVSVHLVYEIWDSEVEEVFKFGITDDKIELDGLPKRVRKQLQLLNLAVGWERYSARIMKTDIPGRESAERIGDDFMDDFELKFGRRPRGNFKRNRKK